MYFLTVVESNKSLIINMQAIHLISAVYSLGLISHNKLISLLHLQGQSMIYQAVEFSF